MSNLRLDRFEAAAKYFELLTDLGAEVNMSDWGPSEHDVSEVSVDGYVSCGTPACMAGWLAVSPDFRAAGGEADCGIPRIGDCYGTEAIEHYFGVDEDTAEAMCDTGSSYLNAEDFYRVRYSIDIDTAAIAKRFRQIARDGKV